MLSLIMHFFIKELDLKAPRDNRKIMIVILEKYLEKSLGFFDSISKSNFDFTETSV